jgi:polysaccharide biosynthesis/export protein
VELRIPVNRRAWGRRWRQCFIVAPLLAVLLTGCADCRFLSQKCPQPRDPQAAADTPAPDVAYRVGCPDVLEVAFTDFPGWDALASVDLDGRLPLQSPGCPLAEGRSLNEIRDELARLAGVSPERVAVRLAAPRSSRIFVHGPIRGRTRIVPYQGPEPVIDFLTRVGGLPPGSKLNQVYVIRPNVAAGAQPEVFRVNVPAVLIDGNPATNVALQPSDEVYIGETSRSVFARVLPDWLGPAYRRLSGLLPDDWWPFSKTRRP